MAQGKFTKQEAFAASIAVGEMFDALPKSKRLGFAGPLNDILLFLAAANRVAPSEDEANVEMKEP